MVASAAQYRAAGDTIANRAIAQLADLLLALGTDNPERVRDALLATLPDLAQPYLTQSGELAATWYEDLRAATLGGSYFAQVVDEVPEERIAALVRWGVAPLFGRSESTPLSLIGGGLQRLIAGTGRDTIDRNARDDVATVGWSRIARPDACDFCTMLAGRGPVYRSEDAAGITIGAGVDPALAFDAQGRRKRGGIGGGVKARGKQQLGDKYHDFCRCVAEPTFYRREIRTITVRGFEQRVPVLVPIAA